MGILLFIIGVIIMAVAIGASIGLHEVGHLVPAKKFGVRVPQYMIGFGKTLFSVRRGETEYGFKLIPLGGYISMIGMYPPVPTGQGVRKSTTGPFSQLIEDARAVDHERISETDENRVFYKLPIYKRIIIMLGGPVMNLLIGVVCVAILILGFGSAQPTTTVSSVSQCVKTVSSEQENNATAACAESDPKAPAAAAGLKAGDVITRFARQDISSWNQLTDEIKTHANQSVEVTVLRDGKTENLTIEPMLTARPVMNETTGTYEKNEDGSYKTTDVGFIGVSPSTELVPGTAGDILPTVGEQMKSIYSSVLRLPARGFETARVLVTNGERDVNGPMSVVGVGRIAGEIASTDQINLKEKAATLVSMIGTLNLFLFALNLVPLLPLDGGHVLGALWEGVRKLFARLFGRQNPGPFDAAKLLPLTFVVAGAFGLMSLILITADIFKPITLL